MESQDGFGSRQVRRAEERKLDKQMNRNKKRREQQPRKAATKTRRTERELNRVAERGRINIPVANLIGQGRICRGWFSPGQFR